MEGFLLETTQILDLIAPFLIMTMIIDQVTERVITKLDQSQLGKMSGLELMLQY